MPDEDALTLYYQASSRSLLGYASSKLIEFREGWSWRETCMAQALLAISPVCAGEGRRGCKYI